MVILNRINLGGETALKEEGVKMIVMIVMMMMMMMMTMMMMIMMMMMMKRWMEMRSSRSRGRWR